MLNIKKENILKSEQSFKFSALTLRKILGKKILQINNE